MKTLFIVRNLGVCQHISNHTTRERRKIFGLET